MNRSHILPLVLFAAISISFIALSPVFALKQANQHPTPPVVLDMGKMDAVVRIPGIQGETIIADAVSMEFASFEIAAASPFSPPLTETISITVSKVIYDPALSTVSLITLASNTDPARRSLIAAYNPATQRWNITPQPLADDAQATPSVLLRDGSPMVARQLERSSQSPVTYSCTAQ